MSQVIDFKPCICLSLQYEKGLSYGYSPAILKNVIDCIYKNNHNIPPIVLLTNYKDLTKSIDNRISEIKQVKTELYKPVNINTPYGGIGYYKVEIFSMYNYDRIIYLDLDTLVKSDISDMWNIEKFNNKTAFLLDEHLNMPQFNHDKTYYNCGVMIINKKLIVEDFYTTLLYFTNNHPPIHYNGDQDIINLTLSLFPHLKVGNLELEYNTLALSITNEEYFKKAKIIHFATIPKPWTIKNDNSLMKKLYYRVLTGV